MDIALDRWIAGPFVGFFLACNRTEERITRFLSREPDSNVETDESGFDDNTPQDISTAA